MIHVGFRFSCVKTNSAGTVRGHASLMRPAKPYPGVPFACFAAIRQSERVLSDYAANLCGGGVIEPPLLSELRTSRSMRRTNAPPVVTECQDGTGTGDRSRARMRRSGASDAVQVFPMFCCCSPAGRL